MLNIKKYLCVFGLGILPRIRPVFFIFSFLLLFQSNAYAQENLVPNGSFEEYDTCPFNQTNFDVIKHWYNPTLASPDYYNACNNPGGAGVPNNDWGWQEAQDGEAYAGVAIDVPLFVITATDYREYIQVKLKKSLEKGQLYCWSLYVSLLDNVDYASDNISLAFSDDSITLNSESILPLTPFFQSDKIILDTINWTHLSGEYVAHGGERFLTIGGPPNDGNTNFIKVMENSLGGPDSYYYIDNVSIRKCKTSVTFPNVFTPNQDGINELFKPITIGVRNYQLTILNQWGNVVFDQKDASIGWNGKYKGRNCSEGVYFYKCTYTDDNNKRNMKTGFIHLIR